MNINAQAVKRAAHLERKARNFSTVTRAIPSKKKKLEKKLSTKCWLQGGM